MTMKNRILLALGAALALVLIWLPHFVEKTSAQGAGNFPLSSALGTDLVQVQRGASPVFNSLTVNQIASFVNQGDSTPRNVLLGGDFTSNPFQSGTTQAADITNTVTTGPDGWRFQGGASSAINWSKQTGAADVPTGFGASLRFQRKAANADTTAICVTQVLESKNSTRFQGQTAVFSFFALDGANFSPAGANVQATIAYGTGTDDTTANFNAGSWANQTNAFQGNVSTSATWTRYTVSGAVPVQVAATNVNQVGVKICFTPVGTAGANDWVELAGIQLEISPGAIASPFDYHLPATELNVAQRTLIVINEPANGINVAVGQATTATNANITIALPDSMRAAPSITTALGTWKVTVAAGTQQACTALASNTGHSPIVVNLSCTVAANLAAGNATQLQGAGGAGKITASAEL